MLTGHYVLRQGDGKLAIWNSIEQMFVMENASRKAVLKWGRANEAAPEMFGRLVRQVQNDEHTYDTGRNKVSMAYPSVNLFYDACKLKAAHKLVINRVSGLSIAEAETLACLLDTKALGVFTALHQKAKAAHAEARAARRAAKVEAEAAVVKAPVKKRSPALKLVAVTAKPIENRRAVIKRRVFAFKRKTQKSA